MGKYIQMAGILGFFICLCMMYTTDLGVRGIRVYDPAFQSPDTKFHYSAGQLTQTFEEIGDGGWAVFQKYLILDCVFTLCFLIVMFTITTIVFTEGSICYFMLGVCIFRGVSDLLENTMMLLVLRQFPDYHTQLVTICSYVTTIKFILLYIWISGLLIQIAASGFLKAFRK